MLAGGLPHIAHIQRGWEGLCWGNQAAAHSWDGIYGIYPEAGDCCQQPGLIRVAMGNRGSKGQPAQPRPCTGTPKSASTHCSSAPAMSMLQARRQGAQAGSSSMHLELPRAALRAGQDTVPPSPCAPRQQEPPLTTKDGAGGAGQRHRRKENQPQLAGSGTLSSGHLLPVPRSATVSATSPPCQGGMFV